MDTAAETPAERANVSATVLGEQFGFAGDAATYDDPTNADLIRARDRRRARR